MDNTRLPKHALNYKPRGRRYRGRPRKRWKRVDVGKIQSMVEDDDDDGYLCETPRKMYLNVISFP